MQELQTIGFIQAPRYRKERPGVWKIGISKQPDSAAIDRSATASLASELMIRGVSVRMAHHLVKSHSADAIRERIRHFDDLMCARDGRVAKNPAGFLVASIRDNYAVARQSDSGCNQKSGCQRAVAAPATVSESPSESVDLAQLKQWLDTLDPETRRSVEERALAAANDFQRKTLARLKSEGNPLWRGVWAQLLSAAQREGIGPKS